MRPSHTSCHPILTAPCKENDGEDSGGWPEIALPPINPVSRTGDVA